MTSRWPLLPTAATCIFDPRQPCPLYAFCHLPLTPRNSTLLYPKHCTHLQRVLSDAWSPEEVMLQFYTSDSGIAVIDNLLTDEALEELLAFAEQSTIWHDDGRTSMRVALDSAISSQRGYLGAYKHEGFACGLLFQVCSCGWGGCDCQPRVPSHAST